MSSYERFNNECVNENVNVQDSKTGETGESDNSATTTTDNDENSNIVQTEKKRWYILAVFTMLAFTQSQIWTMWGPIAASAEFAYGWSDSTIALLGNWGCIVPLITLVPFTWAMSEKGIKVSVLVTVTCMFIGTGLKCITSVPHIATWLIHLGQIFNNVGVPVTMAGPPVISAIWFPAHQRTTATAISAGLGGTGEAMAFLLGPMLVPDVNNVTHNCSNNNSQSRNVSDCDSQQHFIRQKIMTLMYIQLGMTGSLFVLIICYFPSKPKTAPSITSFITRTDLKTALKDLMRIRTFWMVALLYAIGGIHWGWFAVLDIIVKPLGISEKTAGWIGFWCGILPQIISVPVGLASDIFAKRMKTTLTILSILGLLCFLIFALSCSKIILFKTEILFASSISGSICIWSGYPLIYELVSECTYPISEAVTNNVMQAMFNITTFVFLLMFMFSNIGTSWVNWALVGGAALSVPLWLGLKVQYKRYDIDTGKKRHETAQPDIVSIY